jgi:hypothetical protein
MVYSSLPTSESDFESFKLAVQPRWHENGTWGEIYTTYLKESEAYSVLGIGGDYACYIFVVVPESAESRPPTIESLTYESLTASQVDITEEMGKVEAVFRARIDLQCDIDVFPYIDPDTIDLYPNNKTHQKELFRVIWMSVS